MTDQSHGQDSQAHTAVNDLVIDLEDIWVRICAEEHPAADELAAMARIAKRLTDIAKAQGYPKVADLASIIEVMISPILDEAESLTREFKEIVRDYIKALQRLSMQRPIRVGDTTITVPNAGGMQNEGRQAIRVFILEPNADLARELAVQIDHFGYAVSTVEKIADLEELMDVQSPDAVVLDYGSWEDDQELCDAAVRLREKAGDDLPIILIASSGHLESRLAAARAGADAYVVRPFDLHELIDQLDRVTADHDDEPFHVVIVEDSSTQATYYAAILKKAGMETTVINDPMNVLDVLHEHSVDLILMDMYMPRCNGMELARVIRQFPRYASIPIVFLSAETEIDRQLDAMSLGGDDFLTKPINPTHLIRSVAIRAERARTLRTFMLTDNLTGLLNHTRIKEQLHNEVARAERNGSPLSFAMLDIDHFKSVNDTHGHPVGDRVIKTMARVLQQRLRKTDYIGRYGGEEFAVILPEADAAEAMEILDEIRESFRKIRQFASGGVFAVTFSGGIATFPKSSDAIKLALNADKALYQAKRKGRNRIEISEE